ncbi:hypothetical protein B0H11DRAFT_2066707 [Mycena galericulata]|nr:hypothetical protein B0H11DRAFT_2066707 [Mycena galericulata]
MSRHPQLYFEEGTMTIKASDGTLYNVYRAPLIRQLVNYFRGMLTLPESQAAILLWEWFERSKQLGLECTSDATAPLLPPQFPPQRLKNSWTSCFCKDAPSLETACAVLKLSHFFVVESGIAYSRYHLDHHPDLNPVLRLKLGFDYHFVDWITTGFDELMTCPIKDISAEDEELMGWPAYRALARAQAEVLDLRLSLAVARIPDVNHWNGCHTHTYCQSEWAKICQPTICGGMNMECHRRTCDGLKDTPDKVSILRGEEGDH